MDARGEPAHDELSQEIDPGRKARVLLFDVHSVALSLLVPGFSAGYATAEVDQSRTEGFGDTEC